VVVTGATAVVGGLDSIGGAATVACVTGGIVVVGVVVGAVAVDGGLRTVLAAARV